MIIFWTIKTSQGIHLQQLSMQQKQEVPKLCQLCLKQQEISQMKRSRKRELSLQSIYRKDYHTILGQANQVNLPARSKNQSTHLAFQGKSYFDFNSTYLANFKARKGDLQEKAHAQQTIPNPEKIPQTFVSTYKQNHNLLPLVHKQQAYKIADFQFYNIKTPFAQTTEYKQHYRKQSSKKQQGNHDRGHKELSKKQLRLFDTTQKAAFRGDRSFDRNPAMIPIGTMAALPTSTFLYNSTYNQEYVSSGSNNEGLGHKHKISDHNGRRSRMVKNYYF